ncbi:MAG: Crp/Fnr family transcriptional regulator [Rhodothermaceae bacterium]
MNKIERIKESGFVTGFSEKNREKLIENGKLRETRKKEIIFLEGDRGHSFYICISGNVQLTKTSPDGKEIVIKVIKPGEIFAEVILFEKDIYPVTAIAVSNSDIFEISKPDFLSLLDEKSFREDFIRSLIRKQRYLTEQIKYLTIHDVEDRLFNFLKEQFGDETEIILSLSKKDVAAAIGTTPETLSRLILRLSKENILSWEGKKITLLKNLNKDY